MDPALMSLVLVFPLLLGLLLLLLITRRATSNSNEPADHRRRLPLPPSPPRSSTLPIIGHVHLVAGAHPHISLRDLAYRHGDDGLLFLRLGQVPNLVVSSPRAAEAILRTHDHAFASRPPSAVAAVLFSGPSDVAYAPYGEQWRQLRKIVTTHLLSARKVNALRRAREEEVRLVLREIKVRSGGTPTGDVVLDVSDLLSAFVNDVVCRAVSGKFSRDQGRNKTFRELSSGNGVVLGGFNLEDSFPSLALTPIGTMVCAKARRLKKRWDELLDTIIDEHSHAAATKPSSSRLQTQENSEDEDFIDVLVSVQQEYGLTREQVKVILLEMFAAGTDTSSIVLEYSMVELIRNPQVMSKLQAEIINNTPQEQGMVKEEDLNKMSYLKAVVKETLRLHPPVPLLLPRLSMKTCDVNGYTVPAATRVIVNAWAIARDPESWEKPDEFIPERFLLLAEDDDNGGSFMGLKGRDFRLMPFGAGRRMCPGMNFGMATVEIMLANLLHSFDWELPAGTKREDIDMTDVFGLTMRRRQKLRLVPRLK